MGMNISQRRPVGRWDDRPARTIYTYLYTRHPAAAPGKSVDNQDDYDDLSMYIVWHGEFTGGGGEEGARARRESGFRVDTSVAMVTLARKLKAHYREIKNENE